MKRMLWFFVCVLATGALARTVWVLPSEERVRWWAPPDRAADETGQEWLEPTPSKLVECGWVGCEVGDAVPMDCVVDFSADPPVRRMTQQELDDRAAAEAAAQAEAEALRGPPPEVFVPMLNSDGDPVGTARLVVIEGSLSVLASTNSASPQKPWAEQKDQILAQLGIVAESRASAAAARIAVKQTVLAGELPEEDLAQIVDLWPAWSAGVSYAVDEIVRHEGSLYKVVQAHTSQPDWTPDAVPALFAAISPPGIIAAWVQPTGAHDTYAAGDRVTHKDSVWESTVDNNSWEPGVYGWVEVE